MKALLCKQEKERLLEQYEQSGKTHARFAEENGLNAKIKKFCLFDDDFMSKVFENDIDLTQFLLNIIMQRKDLTVTESKGQVQIKNLWGRSVKLDVKAKDKEGKLYNIEV